MEAVQLSIGIFGGSFDPPHLGHAQTIKWVLGKRLVQTIYLVPAFRHAFGKQSAPYDFRCRLARALADDVAPYSIAVDRSEEELGSGSNSPVYTYDLLRHLSKTHGEFAKFRLIVGSDILREANAWYKWEEINREFGVIVVGREGYDDDGCDWVVPDYSSTEIRRRIREGRPWKDMVTYSVARMLPGPYLGG